MSNFNQFIAGMIIGTAITLIATVLVPFVMKHKG